jgi:hypothetical protein
MFVGSTMQKAIEIIPSYKEKEGWFAIYPEVLDIDLKKDLSLLLKEYFRENSSNHNLIYLDREGNKLEEQPVYI